MLPRFALGFALIVLGKVVFAGDITHRFLAADSSKQRIAIIEEDGTLSWEMKIGPLHDLHQLENGHLLIQTSWTRVIELDPKTGVVHWEYDATKTSSKEKLRVEIHAFQRLESGATFIAESGRSRIVEVDTSGSILNELKLLVSNPHPHRDTRLVRRLTTGNYLVCHEGDGVVKEYRPSGEVVWEYAVPLAESVRPGHGPEAYGNQCFCALRLPNGNTLISTGNGHRVIEVTPEHEIVWQIAPKDLSQFDLAWITALQVLPSGNIVFVNCHAGEDNPQIIEVNRKKEVVWTFRDFERFGNSLTNVQILSTNMNPVSAVLGQDR